MRYLTCIWILVFIFLFKNAAAPLVIPAKQVTHIGISTGGEIGFFKEQNEGYFQHLEIELEEDDELDIESVGHKLFYAEQRKEIEC